MTSHLDAFIDEIAAAVLSEALARPFVSGEDRPASSRTALFRTAMGRVTTERRLSDLAAADYVAGRVVALWERELLTAEEFERLWQFDSEQNFVSLAMSPYEKQVALRERLRTQYAVGSSASTA